MKRTIQKLLDKKRIQSFGNSMYPLLHNKDVVFFESVHYEEISVNDIIIARNKETFLTHRVIYKSSNYLITKGDNNLKADPKIHRRDIIGRICYVKRGGRIIDPENLYLIQSAHYFNEIVKLQNQLRKHKLEYVFLKGLPIHLYYQKKAPRRMYADCDILFREHDLLEVVNIFKKNGYKYNKSILKKNQKSINEISFYKNVNGFVIVFDVHVSPVFMMNKLENKAFFQDKLLQEMTELFFNKSLYKDINNNKMPILSSSILTMYLSLHFFHHNYKDNFRLELIDKVIRIESPKNKFWENFSDQVNQFKVVNYIYPVLRILDTYYDTPIPLQLLKKMKPAGLLPRFIAKLVVSDSIFNSQNKLISGIQRFLFLLILSPLPTYKKILILFSKEIIYMVWTSIGLYMRSKLYSIK